MLLLFFGKIINAFEWKPSPAHKLCEIGPVISIIRTQGGYLNWFDAKQRRRWVLLEMAHTPQHCEAGQHMCEFYY